MSRTINIRLQFYQTFIFFLFRSAFKMEYIQSTRLEVVNGVQTENFQSKSSNEEGQSPDSIEKPIDYSLSRKRRILDNFNEESPLNKTKKTLNYGSDGHSEDSSCSVSPSQNNLLSSPEMDSPEHAIHCNHNLPEIPIFPNIRLPELTQQPHHQNAAALNLFFHVQQQKQQQAQLFQNKTGNIIHNVKPAIRWNRTPSPPITPSQFVTSNSLPMSPPSSGGLLSLEKDSAYWERRRKNNEAAKRSRDARRQKEQQIAIRAQLLEQENIHLKFELSQLRAENTQIREQFCLLHTNKE